MKFFLIALVTCFLTAVSNAELRTWTAVNGKQVKAEFVSSLRGNVKLRLESGKLYDIPKDKLSKEDHNYISSLYNTDTVVGSGKKEPTSSIDYADLDPPFAYTSGGLFNLTVYKKKGSKIPYTGMVTEKRNGKIVAFSNFKDGLMHGETKEIFTDDNGKRRIGSQTIYEMGRPIKAKLYSDDGRLLGIRSFDGTLYICKSVGWIEVQSYNRDGQRHGSFRKFVDLGRFGGSTKGEATFKNDKVVPNSDKYWRDGVRINSDSIDIDKYWGRGVIKKN